MRAALTANFAEMWRQIEDRRQLNAAFAHEMRTPLTVLKGYDEKLKDSGDGRSKENADTMEKCSFSRTKNHAQSKELMADRNSTLQVANNLTANSVEEKENGKHFGIGLYLCRILCGHHGGWLKIEKLSGNSLFRENNPEDNVFPENMTSGVQIIALFQCKQHTFKFCRKRR